MFVVQYKFF